MKRYLKKFTNYDDYETSKEEILVKPYDVLINETKEVIYKKIPKIIYFQLTSKVLGDIGVMECEEGTTWGDMFKTPFETKVSAGNLRIYISNNKINLEMKVGSLTMYKQTLKNVQATDVIIDGQTYEFVSS
jgi:hypothetical protein